MMAMMKVKMKMTITMCMDEGSGAPVCVPLLVLQVVESTMVGVSVCAWSAVGVLSSRGWRSAELQAAAEPAPEPAGCWLR
jgi:hypothetical protein